MTSHNVMPFLVTVHLVGCEEKKCVDKFYGGTLSFQWLNVVRLCMRPTPFAKHNLKVYKVMQRNMLPIKPGTPGEPLHLSQCTGYFYCVTQHTGPKVLRPIQRMKQIMVNCLAKGHRRHKRDLNPHSADHKHQSLGLMLWVLTARPHLDTIIIVKIVQHTDSPKEARSIWWHVFDDKVSFLLKRLFKHSFILNEET